MEISEKKIKITTLIFVVVIIIMNILHGLGWMLTLKYEVDHLPSDANLENYKYLVELLVTTTNFSVCFSLVCSIIYGILISTLILKDIIKRSLN